MSSILTLVTAAILNRVRGGGLGAGALPGHTRLWASGGMLLLAALAGHDWRVAAAWSLGFLAWAAMPLNRWDVLGRVPQATWPTKIEEAVEAISHNLRLPFSFGPLAVRECLGVLPALVAVAALAGGPWWLPGLAPLYALGVVAVTELAHRLRMPRFRAFSEPAVGCLWGVLLIVA